MIRDSSGREIRYLRLSLTQACPMRCVYCRPEGYRPESREAMSPEEIESLVGHLAREHGLRKARLTGGEPTTRRDLPEIVRRLAGIPGLEDFALTTNGLALERLAGPLADAGLRRVNVSLDSLDAARFRRITGLDGPARVLAGIEAARKAGLWPVKLNAVVVRGENDDELPALLRFAIERGVEIRFIELMPMGPLAGVWAERFIPESEMRRTLESDVASWEALPFGSESARRYRIRLDDGRIGTVGFITAMSCNFCAGCDRIRVAADGSLYPCLMGHPAGTLLPALRPRFDPALLEELLRSGLMSKAPEHPAAGVAVMTGIGG